MIRMTLRTQRVYRPRRDVTTVFAPRIISIAAHARSGRERPRSQNQSNGIAEKKVSRRDAKRDDTTRYDTHGRRSRTDITIEVSIRTTCQYVGLNASTVVGASADSGGGGGGGGRKSRHQQRRDSYFERSVLVGQLGCRSPSRSPSKF